MLNHETFIADVALVYTDGSGAVYGSGRLIACGLILTAAHVVRASVSSEWNVLLVRDQKQDGTWAEPYKATAVWTGKGDLDLALLQITGVKETLHPRPTISPVFVAYDQVAAIDEVCATGFPEAQSTTTKTRDFSVFGRLWITTRGAPYRWLVNVAPDDHRGWKGMSGAGVCHIGSDDKISLLGVVQEVPPNFSYGPLDVARISNAFDDPNFTARLETALGTAVHIEVFSIPDGATKVKLLQRQFVALTNGITGNLLARTEGFLSEYLVRPTAPFKFLGRAEELNDLQDWLSKAESPPYYVLTGPAGRGKSTLVVHWAAQISTDDRYRVVFVPISIRFGVTRPADIAKVWLERLRAVGNESQNLGSAPESWIDEIHRYLINNRSPEDPRLLVIVDGVDEASDSNWFRFPTALGHGIKMLISSRILAGETDLVDVAQRIGLSAQFLGIQLQPLTQNDLIGVNRDFEDQVPTASERLWRLSKGDPLLVRLYLEWFVQHSSEGGRIPADDPQDEETALEKYMRMWWDDVFRPSAGKAFQEEDVRQFLYVLACAAGPLMTEDVTAVAGIDPLSIDSARNLLSRIVIGDGTRIGYAYTHPRISQFFAERLMTKGQRSDMEQKLLVYCRTTASNVASQKSLAQDVSRYVLSFCIDHLHRAHAPIDDFLPLLRSGWMLAWHTADSHYGGYIADLDRIRAEARSVGHLRVETRCSLSLAAVVSLSEAVPSYLIVLAVQERLITQIQAVEMLRQISDDWKRALAIVTISRTLDHSNALKTLEIVRVIRDRDSRLLASAGLLEYLPRSSQEIVASEALELLPQSSALQVLLIRTIALKAGLNDKAHLVRDELDDLYRALGRSIWGNMTAYHRRLGEIISALHPTHQEIFARLAEEATGNRGYRYDEHEHAQELVDAIVEFSPLDLLTKLEKLLGRSPHFPEESLLRIQARYAILGDAPRLQALTAKRDVKFPCAVSSALHLLSRGEQQRWARACIANLAPNDQAHIADAARCLIYYPPMERAAIVRQMWTVARRLHLEYLAVFGTVALPNIDLSRRMHLADRFAEVLEAQKSPDLQALAQIGLYASDAWVSRIQQRLSGRTPDLVILAPRFSNSARDAVLRSVLDGNQLTTDETKALIHCFDNLTSGDQKRIATEILERITGKSTFWAETRQFSLTWAELFESFVPLLVKTLGKDVIKPMERAVSKIKYKPDKALALASLALSAKQPEALRLAISAFIQLAGAEDSELHHRASDLIKIFPLLPSDSVNHLTEKGLKPERAQEIVQLVKSQFRNKDISEFEGLIQKGDFAALTNIWEEKVDSPYWGEWRLKLCVDALQNLAVTQLGQVTNLWRIGLDVTSRRGQDSLVRYLTRTFSLLAVLVTQEQLQMIVEDVVEVATWPWQ